MRRLAVLALAVSLTGCGPDIKTIVAALAASDRSWCFYWAGTPAFSGPFRVGGSGIDGGSAICTAETFTVNQGMGANGAPVVVTPGGDVILRAPPRILQQEPGALREIEPPTGPARAGDSAAELPGAHLEPLARAGGVRGDAALAVP